MSQRVLLGYFVTLFQRSVNVNIYARFTPVEKRGNSTMYTFSSGPQHPDFLQQVV